MEAVPAGDGQNGCSSLGRSVERLKSRRDFLAANQGVRVPMPAFVLLAHRRRPGCPVADAGPQSSGCDPVVRVGFTVSKKLGNAVRRNRARRRLREVVRLALPESGLQSGFAGCDLVVIGRLQPAEQSFEQLLADARRAFARAERKLRQA